MQTATADTITNNSCVNNVHCGRKSVLLRPYTVSLPPFSVILNHTGIAVGCGSGRHRYRFVVATSTIADHDLEHNMQCQADHTMFVRTKAITESLIRKIYSVQKKKATCKVKLIILCLKAFTRKKDGCVNCVCG